MKQSPIVELSIFEKRNIVVGYFWWIFRLPEFIHEIAPYVRDALKMPFHKQPNYMSYDQYNPFSNNALQNNHNITHNYYDLNSNSNHHYDHGSSHYFY